MTAMRYVMYFRFVNDVVFSYYGKIKDDAFRPVHQVAATGRSFPSRTASCYWPAYTWCGGGGKLVS